MLEEAETETAAEAPGVGAAIFAAVMGVVLLGYAWTIYDGSRNTTDWLMILPAGIAGAAAVFWAGWRDLRAWRASGQPAAGLPREALSPILMIVAMALYAVTLPWIGFDIGTAAFLAVALWIQGERRALFLVLNPILGALLLVWIFRDLLLVRLPTILF